MTKQGFDLERGCTVAIQRSLRGGTPSCVVLIVGAGTTSFMEQELTALTSGCLSPEAARRAAVLGWAIDGARPVMHSEARARDEHDFAPEQTEVVAVAPNYRPALLSHGALLEAGARYWVPPQSRIWLEGERVCLAPLAPGHDHPLDALLTSLARSWGPRSIAVLPMVRGADGERGVCALRAAGGLALPCSDEPEEAPPLSGSRLRWHSS
jgi:hypothetical protein